MAWRFQTLETLKIEATTVVVDDWLHVKCNDGSSSNWKRDSADTAIGPEAWRRSAALSKAPSGCLPRASQLKQPLGQPD